MSPTKLALNVFMHLFCMSGHMALISEIIFEGSYFRISKRYAYSFRLQVSEWCFGLHANLSIL
jgi:hypothetical protein